MKATTPKSYKPTKVIYSPIPPMKCFAAPEIKNPDELPDYPCVYKSRGIVDLTSHPAPGFMSNPRTIAISITGGVAENCVYLNETAQPAPAKSTYKPRKVTMSAAPMYGNANMFINDTTSIDAWAQEHEYNTAPREITHDYWNPVFVDIDDNPIIRTIRTVAKTEAAPAPVEIVTTYREPRAKKVTIFTPKTVTPVADPRAAVLAKYAWIERWQNDPEKSRYKSTINNGIINRRDELAALDNTPINITAELAAITCKINA